MLALLGLFYPVVCFGFAIAIAGIRWYQARGVTREPERNSESFAHVLPVTAAVAVTWPGIVRPLLDGDSLGYHLPNAASWANAHSLWTTTTAYWWYPPGSELFASSLFLIAGPQVLGLAGFAALLLLALRIEAFARRAGFSVWSAGAVAAMVVTVPIIGLQGASLQNDVWLGAWTLECLWALTYDRSALTRCLALCAIIKPVGFLFAAIIAAFALPLTQMRTHTRPRLLLAALGTASLLAIWTLHVATLWPNAVISPLQDAYPHVASTLILAHGIEGATTFAHALIAQGLGTVILFATVPAAILLAKSRARQHVPWIFFVLFLIEPFGFNNAIPQLATGSSLRFLIAALVAGIVGSLDGVARWSTLIGIAVGVIAIVQVHKVIDIFWNDANTHGVALVALAIGGIIWLRSKMPSPLVPAALIGAICAYGIHLDDDPARYYDASLGSNAAPSQLFDWLARNRPPRVVAANFGSGTISVVVPHAFVANATDDPCNEAAFLRAVLVVVGSPPLTCGRKLFADAYATVYEIGSAGDAPKNRATTLVW